MLVSEMPSDCAYPGLPGVDGRWIRTEVRRQSGRNMPSSTSFSDSTLYMPDGSTRSNPSGAKGRANVTVVFRACV
jgi:hypothetical protein